jgi:hypothetical protein
MNFLSPPKFQVCLLLSVSSPASSKENVVLITCQRSTIPGCLENQKQISKAEASVVGRVAGMVADLVLQGTFRGLRYVFALYIAAKSLKSMLLAVVQTPPVKSNRTPENDGHGAQALCPRHRQLRGSAGMC